jgi:hypothetical protein
MSKLQLQTEDDVVDAMLQHPAIEWALQTRFSPTQVDCTTAIALKILDNKCKMLPGEITAVLAIYDVVKKLPADLFDDDVHDIISRSRQQLSMTEMGEEVSEKIHELRLQAEACIPRPVMKTYKAFLRDGLFG